MAKGKAGKEKGPKGAALGGAAGVEPVAEQHGVVITLVGIDPKWDATREDLDRLGAVSLTRREDGAAVLTFASKGAATRAFGDLFVDGALGAADAMPDETKWISDDMRQVKRGRR
jgi:hypothetical protein